MRTKHFEVETHLLPRHLSPGPVHTHVHVCIYVPAPLQVRKVPEINDEFAQSIRKDLTLEELTNEVEKAVMEEAGTSKKDARNRRGNRGVRCVVLVVLCSLRDCCGCVCARVFLRRCNGVVPDVESCWGVLRVSVAASRNESFPEECLCLANTAPSSLHRVWF